MLRLFLLLISIPSAFALNCTSSQVESWCKCIDLEGDLLKLVCTGIYGIPRAKYLPDNTAELLIIANNVTNLTANFFNKEMPQLKVLNLTGNEIMYIDSSAFTQQDFKVLEELILDNNKLVLNGSKFIDGLKILKILSMKNAFFNGTYASLIGTSLKHAHTHLLESIILDDNDFSGGLVPSTFNFGKEINTHMKRISLRNTSLELFFQGTLNETHLPNLALVDLSKNKLQTIEKVILDDLDMFLNNLTVDFTGNPFVCNCGLYDFVLWLNSSNFVNVSNKENYICSSDSLEKNRGRKLLELDPVNDLKDLCYDIEVKDSASVLWPSYIALSITFGIVAILAMIILFLRRGECYAFFHRMFNVAHDTLNDKGGYMDMDNPYIRETPAVDV